MQFFSESAAILAVASDVNYSKAKSAIPQNRTANIAGAMTITMISWVFRTKILEKLHSFLNHHLRLRIQLKVLLVPNGQQVAAISIDIRS